MNRFKYRKLSRVESIFSQISGLDFHMDVNTPLSYRANAFSIQSLMSGSLSDLTLGGFGYPVVPAQRSTDCCFDWGQNGAYGPGMKTMEGTIL